MSVENRAKGEASVSFKRGGKDERCDERELGTHLYFDCLMNRDILGSFTGWEGKRGRKKRETKFLDLLGDGSWEEGKGRETTELAVDPSSSLSAAFHWSRRTLVVLDQVLKHISPSVYVGNK